MPISLADAARCGVRQVNRVRRLAARRYVAAVPELSAGLPPVPGLPWESLSHRQVLAELAAPGWVPCGVGDWAVALRSPEGTVVARVCPWIELAADLEGGGSVVFLEFAAPVEHAIAGQVAEQWRTAAGDAELEEVRRAAQGDRCGVPEVDALVGQVRPERGPHPQSRRRAARGKAVPPRSLPSERPGH